MVETCFDNPPHIFFSVMSNLSVFLKRVTINKQPENIKWSKPEQINSGALLNSDTCASLQMATSTRSHSGGSWIRYLKRRAKTKVMWDLIKIKIQ